MNMKSFINGLWNQKWIILTLIALLIVYIRLNVMIQEDFDINFIKDKTKIPIINFPASGIKNLNTFDIKIDILKVDYNETTKKHSLSPIDAKSAGIVLKPNASHTLKTPLPRGNIGYAVRVYTLDKNKPENINISISAACFITKVNNRTACGLSGFPRISQLQLADSNLNNIVFKEKIDTKFELVRDDKTKTFIFKPKQPVSDYIFSFTPNM